MCVNTLALLDRRFNSHLNVGDSNKTQNREQHLQSDERMIFSHFSKGDRCFFWNANPDFLQDHICVLPDELSVHVSIDHQDFLQRLDLPRFEFIRPLRTSCCFRAVCDCIHCKDFLLHNANDVVVEARAITDGFPGSIQMSGFIHQYRWVSGPAAMTFLPVAIAAFTTPGPPVTTTIRVRSCFINDPALSIVGSAMQENRLSGAPAATMAWFRSRM